MRSREEVSNVLKDPIPSARQIVEDAEGILDTFHGYISGQQAARIGISPGPTSSSLANLMANMSQEIQQYQEESNMGPALHAARQVAYWSSVFVSMVSNEATTSTSSTETIPHTTSISFPSLTPTVTSNVAVSTLSVSSTASAPVISYNQAATAIPTAPIVSSPTASPSMPTTSFQSSYQPSVSFNQSTTSSLPVTSRGNPPASTFSLSLSSTASAPVIFYRQAATAIPTVPIVSSPTASRARPTTSFQPAASAINNQQTSTATTIPTASLVTTPSLPTTSFLSSYQPAASFNQPTSSLPVTNQGNPPASTFSLSLSSTASAPVIFYRQAATAIPTVPIVSSPTASRARPTTSFQPAASAINNQQTSTATTIPTASLVTTPSLPTTSFLSSYQPAASFNQPTSSLPVTNQGNPSASTFSLSDPATILIYREYGSGTLPEWLDSLNIPRNVQTLHQIKEIWKNGGINCPPLCKWTKVMRNHRAPNAGKNSSLFSQRKFMYTFFKNNNFDENAISGKYHEVKPGNLYKILNAKKQ